MRIATGGDAAPVFSARCRGPDQSLDRDPLRVERVRGPARSRAGCRPRDGEWRPVSLPVHGDHRLLRHAPVAALAHAAAAHARHGGGDGSRARALRIRPVGRGDSTSATACFYGFGAVGVLYFIAMTAVEHRGAGAPQRRHEHQHVGGRHAGGIAWSPGLAGVIDAETGSATAFGMAAAVEFLATAAIGCSAHRASPARKRLQPVPSGSSRTF